MGCQQMIRKEVNFRESDESAYGWEYLKPYLENSENKPFYCVIEQIFREHEIYKGIAENITTIQEANTKQLDKIQKEVHFSLLRTGDAEKNVRTLLQCWNTHFYLNNVTKFLGMNQMVTPPMEQAISEVASYYRELGMKKRSREESLVSQKETTPMKEPLAESKTLEPLQIKEGDDEIRDVVTDDSSELFD